MRESINRFRNTNLFFQVLFALLIVSTLGLATLPAQAGGAADKAKKAFADWKAAQEGVAAAQAKLADAQRALQNAMTAVAKSGGKPTAEQEAALAGGRAAVARAEEALRLAEKQELAARVALEAAIAELEDGPLKDQLKRERNYPTVVNANGLQTINFETKSGKLSVNLPDDIRAGDTISGTVVVEPKGDNAEERTKNLAELNGYVVEFDPPKSREKVRVVLDTTRTTTQAYKLDLPKGAPGDGSPGQLQVDFFGWSHEDKSPRDFAPPQGQIFIATSDFSPPQGNIIAVPDNKFKVPTMGQQGRPVVISGPFDGDFQTTILSLEDGVVFPGEGVTFTAQILTESPREITFQSPTNIAGPANVVIKEGNTETKGTYRNVGVNLTAPKTNLLKGESTTLKVEVSGLQGITEPVPLHLTKGGVVNMQGGDAQTMSIKPAEVQGNGTYTTTRTITGVQAGGWNATATVVVYDVCLEDDGDPLRVLLFMTTTGDFKFCPGRGSGGSAALVPLTSTDFTGGISVQAGDGLDVVTRNGAITAADFRFTGGKMKLQIDSLTHAGRATVQTTNPKQTFTITDRDTRNNTCTCQ